MLFASLTVCGYVVRTCGGHVTVGAGGLLALNFLFDKNEYFMSG